MSELATGTVAILGLGAMGRPMAATLLRAGRRVAAYDVRPEAGDALRELGAEIAASPAAAARGAAALIVMVHNAGQVEAALFGPGGAIDALPAGALVLLMCTVAPADAARLGAECAARGLRLLDAPVSGGPPGARSGSLSIMVGGPAEVLAEARPILEILGDPARIWHVGPEPGHGQSMKMINQLMAGVNIAAAAEAMALAARAGLATRQAFDIVSQSAGGSWMFSDRVPRMLSGQFSPPNSVTETFAKDLGIILDAADGYGLPLFVTTMARQVFQMAMASGYAAEDDAGIIRLFERWTGAPAGPRPSVE